jgi:hypothetical protein
MAWLEGSALGHVMRDNGVWFYGIINLTHILGVGTLFGSVVILDLRMLGVWSDAPLAAISRPTTRMAAVGFGVAAVTGAGLLATKATEYVGNPFLFVKFPAIALGLLNVALVHRMSAWRAHFTRELSQTERRQLAAMGGTSLICWLTSISAGRMIGYW